jgi:hypothetical protein
MRMRPNCGYGRRDCRFSALAVGSGSGLLKFRMLVSRCEPFAPA